MSLVSVGHVFGEQLKLKKIRLTEIFKFSRKSVKFLLSKHDYMIIFNGVVILFIINIFFNCIDCQFFGLTENQIIQKIKPYHTTTFTSKTLEYIDTINARKQFEVVRPKMIWSYQNDNVTQIFNHYYFSFASKNLLHKSLIIFYTSNLFELESFIDFLKMVLPVWTFPKCLDVIFRDELTFYNETRVKNILDYAWKNKFLDFSIISSNQAKKFVAPTKVIYQFNPFKYSFEKKLLNADVKIFPNKLQNVHRYLQYLWIAENFSIKFRYPNRKIKIYEKSRNCKIWLILRHMNFTVIVTQ